MNQHAAHSSRLHHTGVTDVMNAKRRVVATRRASDYGTDFPSCGSAVPTANRVLVTVVTVKVTITVTHLREIAGCITRTSDGSSKA
jgi:hypothetical protein